MHIRKGTGSLDIGTSKIIQNTSPQHQVAIQSGFDLSKSLNLDLAYRYVSPLPARSQLIDSYSTADATFRWRMSEHFRLTLAGQNLLQPQHPEFKDDPGPVVGIKRSAYVEISFER